MRLLVTRAETDAAALAKEIQGLGHDPVLQPLLEFRLLEFDPSPLKAAGGIVFTSRNAVRALGGKPGLGSIRDCPIFCVGSETERHAREAGFVTVAAAAETAEALVPKIVAAAGKDSCLVHVTGEHQAFDLAGALKAKGLSIHTLPVYSMEARAAFDSRVARDIEAGKIGGVILMSPRTAMIFAALCEQQGLIECAKALDYFCLSSSVANRLKPLEPLHVHVAQRPNLAALLALLSTLPTPGQDRVI
jgi:uroporphyrinogen-III synthase